MAAPGAVVGVARRALWRANGALKASGAPGVPALSKGEVSFAELTLVLGQAKAALAAEAERQAPAKTTRTPEEEAALRRRLADMMVRLARPDPDDAAP